MKGHHETALSTSSPAEAAPCVPIDHASVAGAFQSPRGRSGQMRGTLRVRRVLPRAGGLWVTGVLTAELREADGSLTGVDSRRVTLPASEVRGDRGLRLVVDPLVVDLMGITVRVERFTIEAPGDVPPWETQPRHVVGRRRPVNGGERP